MFETTDQLLKQIRLSEKLSGRLSKYHLIDDAELMSTLFAARPPGAC